MRRNSKRELQTVLLSKLWPGFDALSRALRSPSWRLRPDAPGRMRATSCLRLAIFSTAMAALALPGTSRGAQPPCPSGGSASGRVSSVDERLDLTMEDSTRLKIAGVDPARPTPATPDLDARGREKLAGWLVGRSVEFRPAEPGQDRWGRVVAFVFALMPESSETRGQARVPVGEALIDAGLARYEPSAQASPCRAALLKAEEDARVSGLGLWADPYYAVIAAADRDSFAEKADSSVIVEGVVTGIGGRRPRITFYFGPRRGWDFSVTVLPRNSNAFEVAYPLLAGMSGQKVRVRGLLDTRFGPQIEISDLDAVEVIGKGKEHGAAAPAAPK
ncbi:MAG: thermonuclease family protein [Beijerinckiaceae bacterium]|nr:thermonuclease family protein [Beijerinckiaceae bacterium]